jgi:hypothetical protein
MSTFPIRLFITHALRLDGHFIAKVLAWQDESNGKIAEKMRMITMTRECHVTF